MHNTTLLKCYTKKLWLFLAVLITGIFCTCCAPLPESPVPWLASQTGACLPTSIVFRESLKGQAVWSEVVVYHYWADETQTKMFGHAICAFLYPVGQNQMYTMDGEGSFRTRAFIDDPVGIAQAAEYARGRQNKIVSATFLK
jgi:hypothetical protein